jgi:hypothetical protein
MNPVRVLHPILRCGAGEGVCCGVLKYRPGKAGVAAPERAGGKASNTAGGSAAGGSVADGSAAGDCVSAGGAAAVSVSAATLAHEGCLKPEPHGSDMRTAKRQKMQPPGSASAGGHHSSDTSDCDGSQ